MKNIILLFLSLCTYAVVNGQQNKAYFQYPEINGDVVFEQVRNFDSITSETLYRFTKAFFVNNTGNSNYSIQMDDPENGMLIGIGSFSNVGEMVEGYALMGSWHFKVRFDVRSSKVRIRFYDFEKHVSGGVSLLKETNKGYKEEIKNKTKRANALSHEGMHINKVISNYITNFVRYIRNESSDTF